MKSIFAIGIFFTLMVTQCFADININGLTEEQKAELALQAAKMKSSIPASDKVNEWVDIGKNIGIAIASVAGELGVAVDKFMESTTGKITVGMIVYKVIGKDIIHYTFGVGFFIIMLSIWIWVIKKAAISKVTIEYPKDSIFKRIKTVDYNNLSENFIGGMLVVLLLIVIVSLFITFS